MPPKGFPRGLQEASAPGTPLPGKLDRASGGLRWEQRLIRRLGEIAAAVVGPAEPSSQKQDVFRRAFVAPVILAIVPVERLHVPGWEAVVIACSAALLYNVPLAYLVFVKKSYMAARIGAFLFDGALLSVASLFVLRAMGGANSSSDLWLAFLVFVVSGGFTLAPAGSLIYTGAAMLFFALGTTLYFPEDSHYRSELPIRLVFFATFGLMSLAMAGELQKRRARLESQNRQTMGMLAKLVEARDTDAGAHLHRIQHLSEALALRVGFSAREAQQIAYASMMHDVGKANVPDAILKKPGSLSKDDWQVMQRHTVWGEELLTENQDFELARQVARWHHERWDGRGYPDGLAGEEIPLAARIVAVADVYDALISERPYKEAWSPAEAIREVQHIAGSQLDPDLVEAFVDLWEEGVIERIAGEVGHLAVEPQDMERAA
jgi:hypothetical protein